MTRLNELSKSIFTFTIIVICVLSIGGLRTRNVAAVTQPSSEDEQSYYLPLITKGKILLNVWSFTNEILTMAIAFEGKHPDVDVVYTMIPMTYGEYQTELMDTLGTPNVPDVVALEAAFMKQFVEDDFLADLGSLMPLAEGLEMFPYVYEAATDGGVVKGYSYQACPGGLFYRRSLAKEYFGTDNPAVMQVILSDMDKYIAAAEVVKTKSGGNTYMVASNGDFMNLFYANRAEPWVVDNTLTVDPMVDKMVKTSKLFRDSGYEAHAPQWEEDWFAGMNDTLTDSIDNPKKIFSYFLPTWGLPYVLVPNAISPDGSSDTSGDWALIPGPMAYQWGGTWVSVMKDSKKQNLAQEFVKFVALDEETLTNWATGVYTYEFLKAIDPTVPEGQSQAAGDFISSQVVAEKITPLFDDSAMSAFLSGQNFYEVWNEAAPNVNASLFQGSDDVIQRALNDPLSAYLEGAITLDEMWQLWKDAVHNEFPELIIE
jgi:multiple sugar transport system substrate-binding protein